MYKYRLIYNYRVIKTRVDTCVDKAEIHDMVAL